MTKKVFHSFYRDYQIYSKLYVGETSNSFYVCQLSTTRVVSSMDLTYLKDVIDNFIIKGE